MDFYTEVILVDGSIYNQEVSIPHQEEQTMKENTYVKKR